MAETEKWWAIVCSECGGFVPARAVEPTELVPPPLRGKANCVRCHAVNVLSSAVPFVIDGRRLRRIKLDSPSDYVK